MCVLEDFLQELNQLFLKHESQSKDGEGGESGVEVDEGYVGVLEVYCLLRQRLTDVRYNWQNVESVAFAHHGKHVSFAREYYTKLLSALGELVRRCGEILAVYSKREEERLPRLKLLSGKLGLSDKVHLCSVGV